MLQHYTFHYVTYVAVDSRQPLHLLQVRIEQCKADPFHQGVDSFLGIAGKRTCPISVIIPYVAKLGAEAGPLVITKMEKMSLNSYYK